MNKVSIFLCAVFVIVSVRINAQDTVCYTFHSKLYLENKDNESYRNEFNFNVYRTYLTSERFVEKNLFYRQVDIAQGNSDTFQVRNRNWCIISNGKPNYFFSIPGF